MSKDMSHLDIMYSVRAKAKRSRMPKHPNLMLPRKIPMDWQMEPRTCGTHKTWLTSLFTYDKLFWENVQPVCGEHDAAWEVVFQRSKTIKELKKGLADINHDLFMEWTEIVLEAPWYKRFILDRCFAAQVHLVLDYTKDVMKEVVDAGGIDEWFIKNWPEEYST